MHPSEPVLEARGLSVPLQHIDGFNLHPVDLDLYPGEILALLGLDTGSQTLLVDALLGLHRLAEGETRIMGLSAHEPQALDRVGTVRRRIGFPASLTVREVIDLVQAHYQHRPPIDELLRRFSLTELESVQTEQLSYEDQRWLAMLLAFAGDPELILLDHPTVGMDLSWRVRLWEHVRDFVSRGGAALISTHLSQEAERIASRVIVFHHGRVLARGTPEQITTDSQMKRVWFRAERVPNLLPNGLKFMQRDDRWTVDTDDPDQVIAALQREGVEWSDLRIDRGDLRSALLHLGWTDDNEA